MLGSSHQLVNSSSLEAKMLFWSLLLMIFPLAIDCRTYMYHYNSTFNPRLNNITLSFKTNTNETFNIAWDINVWNYFDMLNETSKFCE